MYNVGLIKWLYQNGYRQKLIQIITGYKQSYISKMINSPRPYVPTMENINEDQLRRKMVVDRVLECRALPTSTFSDQDKYYIKLLKYCLVDDEKIRKLYYNVSVYKISQTMRSQTIHKEDFNPLLIGISEEDYECFLEAANF